MRITIINSRYQDKEAIANAFVELVGKNSTYEIVDGNIELTHNYDDINQINNLALSIEAETMERISCYTTISSESNKRLIDEVILAKKMLNLVSIGMYDIKSILKNVDNRFPKKEILEYILEGSGIDETFIKVFAETDLNVSKAAKVLYLHRNTMLYKLEKLKSISDFDLRVFVDAYILYSLIEK